MKTNKSMPICGHCFDFVTSSFMSAFRFAFYFPLLHVNTSSVTIQQTTPFFFFFPISFPFISSKFYSKLLHFFIYSTLVLFLFCIVQFIVLLVLSSAHSQLLSHPFLSLFFFALVLNVSSVFCAINSDFFIHISSFPFSITFFLSFFLSYLLFTLLFLFHSFI